MRGVRSPLSDLDRALHRCHRGDCGAPVLCAPRAPRRASREDDRLHLDVSFASEL